MYDTFFFVDLVKPVCSLLTTESICSTCTVFISMPT